MSQRPGTHQFPRSPEILGGGQVRASSILTCDTPVVASQRLPDERELRHRVKCESEAKQGSWRGCRVRAGERGGNSDAVSRFLGRGPGGETGVPRHWSRQATPGAQVPFLT